MPGATGTPPTLLGEYTEMPAFGESFTITIDGNHHGQNCVNVLHGKVRDILGVAVSTIANDLASNTNTGYGQSFVKVLLDRMHVTYKIDRIYVKAGVEEASIGGGSLYNGGLGLDAGVGTGNMCGHALHLQLAASALPRKFARGFFWPLTKANQVLQTSYLSATGIADANVVGALFTGWDAQLANKWYFQVRNSATTATSIVDEVSYLPLVTLMERRTVRGAP